MNGSKRTICPVCNGRSQELRPYRGTHSLFQDRTIAQCESCALVFTSPMPSDSEWELYNSQYYSNAHGGASLDPLVSAYQSGIGKVREEYLYRHISRNNLSPKSILEIGPGTGNMLRPLKHRFPDAKYDIWEADQENRQVLRPLVNQAFEQIEKVAGHYDLIVVSHVLEHMNDPLRFLGQMRDHLNPGGAMFIEVPSRDDLFKNSDEPHVLFFSSTSLQKTLTTARFEILDLLQFGIAPPSNFPQRVVSFFRQKLMAALYKSGAYRILSGKSLSNGTLSALERLAIFTLRPMKEQRKQGLWLRSVVKV